MLNWSISMDTKRHSALHLHCEGMVFHANALFPSVSYKWNHNNILQSCLDACNCARISAEIHAKSSPLLPEKRTAF